MRKRQRYLGTQEASPWPLAPGAAAPRAWLGLCCATRAGAAGLTGTRREGTREDGSASTRLSALAPSRPHGLPPGSTCFSDECLLPSQRPSNAMQCDAMHGRGSGRGGRAEEEEPAIGVAKRAAATEEDPASPPVSASATPYPRYTCEESFCDIMPGPNSRCHISNGILLQSIILRLVDPAILQSQNGTSLDQQHGWGPIGLRQACLSRPQPAICVPDIRRG